GAPPKPAAGAAVPVVAPEAEEETTGDEAAAPADPWTGLLQVGMALWQQFTAGAGNGAAGGTSGDATVGGAIKSLVKRDEKTGETYLKLPVPTTEILDKALRAVGSLLESLRK
ncbi:MAG TPA: hypothetical protein VEL76_18060, partial [Gemmataceae bacterium]|nr:hypothetical protein [Gemmataceae bacterium]